MSKQKGEPTEMHRPGATAADYLGHMAVGQLGRPVETVAVAMAVGGQDSGGGGGGGAWLGTRHGGGGGGTVAMAMAVD